MLAVIEDLQRRHHGIYFVASKKKTYEVALWELEEWMLSPSWSDEEEEINSTRVPISSSCDFSRVLRVESQNFHFGMLTEIWAPYHASRRCIISQNKILIFNIRGSRLFPLQLENVYNKGPKKIQEHKKS